MPQKRSYTVSNGKLVITMTPDERGWYTVTSPIEPGLVTMAKTIPEAFEMAADALLGLRAARRELTKKSRRPLAKA